MQESYDRTEKSWVLGITSLASFMMALDLLVITTAFATIRAEFGSSVETLQWAVNAFNLTFAVLLLTGAALGDRFGRRRVFAAGIALFALASAACALAGTAEALIAARAAQGAGAALVMPLAMAILSGAFARQERARALGIFSGVTGCALIIGPAIGGFITESLGWRWIFWINLPIGLIAIILIFAPLARELWPESRARYSRVAAGRGRSACAGVEPAARQPGGMEQPRGDEHARRWTGVRARLRRLGIARIGTDGTDAAVRVAIVRGRYCRELAVLRRDVRRAVPAAAISAGRARIRAARRRAQAAAVDRRRCS